MANAPASTLLAAEEIMGVPAIVFILIVLLIIAVIIWIVRR